MEKAHLCYCQIPENKLKELARLRFIEKVPTEEMMKQCKDEKQREFVATIALLDVELKDLPAAIPDNPQLLRHLIDCRDHALDILNAEGIILPSQQKKPS